MSAYKQGTVKGGGNCVSIALIKASYSKFEFDEMFQKIDTTQTGYEVALRDSSSVSFSLDELETVKSMVGFRQVDTTDFAIKFKEFSEFCFAAMGKKLQQIKDQEIDFKAAIDKLNNGYSTSNSSELLGVKFKKINCEKVRSLIEYENLIVYNSYHAVYASRGFYDESSSDFPVKLEKLRWNRFGPKCLFKKFCGIQEAFLVVE
ncbi:hypothetical protein [Ekhidna sp.]|uniref:hypothetical protein n=1 Tax=Ekhidna sp. TaxID=2608089 RepID=UPI0032EB2C89